MGAPGTLSPLIPSVHPPVTLLGGSGRQVLGGEHQLRQTTKARKEPGELQSREYRSNKQQVEPGDWSRRDEKEDGRVRSLRGLIKQQLPVTRGPFLRR